MTARLTALDATFLELEQADPAAHMHIGAVMVFAPSAGGGCPSREEVRRRLALRLDALPRFRQRLSSPVVSGGGFPHWEPDPSFDLDHHLRRAALPAPGGTAELLEWAGDFYSHRLDRARPLWEMVVLEGLENGRWALCTKTHHALVDGIGSVDAAGVLLDLEPDAAVEGSWHASPPEVGHHSGLAAAIAGAAHVVRHPRDAVERSLTLADLVIREELVAAPHTSLTAPLGKHRRLATVGLPLDELKAIKSAIGGTVNDVVLTAVSGGLRALLVGRGEVPPAGGRRAMAPVNVRAAEERLALGNRISSLFVQLPVDQPEPLAAHLRVRTETQRLKRSGQALGSSTLLDLAELAPPVLHAVLARSLYGTRLFNVTVTNVPGPQVPMFAFGSRLEDAIPLVPLASDHTLAVAVLSLDRHVVFCRNCDRDAVPDAPAAARGIRETLDALLRIAVAVTSRDGRDGSRRGRLRDGPCHRSRRAADRARGRSRDRVAGRSARRGGRRDGHRLRARAARTRAPGRVARRCPGRSALSRSGSPSASASCSPRARRFAPAGSMTSASARPGGAARRSSSSCCSCTRCPRASPSGPRGRRRAGVCRPHDRSVPTVPPGPRGHRPGDADAGAAREITSRRVRARRLVIAEDGSRPVEAEVP